MHLAHQLTLLVVLSGVLLVLRPLLRGPTLLDRILAVNVIATKTIVLLALVGFLLVEEQAQVGGQPPDYSRAGFFVDIALAYALINFIATIALLRYLEARGVRPTRRLPDGDA
jgi:multicomponent Na+:H+ antiporter subunit F